MVGLRKGCCYRRLEMPYTRKSKYKNKNYIRSVPNHKISRFEMGEKRKNYEYTVKLISKGTLQLRHNAIESARMVVNRRLQDVLGTNYYLKINVYPHHGLRENKMIGGAHADRLQSGMAHSFGKVVGTAAQVKRGKEIFTAHVFKDGVETARGAMKAAGPRMPGTYSVAIDQIK